MEINQIVNQFKKTIIDYNIPKDQVIIVPYSNGHVSEVTMFDGINVADYIICDEQLVKDISRKVARELHVKFKEV